MPAKLEEMRLKELWRLFPIQLAPHQDCWKDWYAEAADALRAQMPEGALAALHHIGSTAVEGIWAKPIVDILAELTADADMEEIANALAARGWRAMSREGERISLNKGYGEHGFEPRVFHLHLRRAGDCDEIYFRDLLRASPNIAKEYEELKLTLWKQYEFDRDAYTEAKTAFVRRFTQLAKLGKPTRGER